MLLFTYSTCELALTRCDSMRIVETVDASFALFYVLKSFALWHATVLIATTEEMITFADSTFISPFGIRRLFSHS